MKMKSIVVILALIASPFIMVQAQNTLKIGYANVDYIISLLPQTKQVESDLQDHEKQLSSQLEAKMQDFQTKYEDFQKNAANMIPEVRTDKQQELQVLQQSIEKFQNDAQGSLQRKQVELLQPVYDKVQTAIDDVAKEKGYTFVFSSGQGVSPVLLYAAREEDNLSNDILKKLGVEPPKKEEAPKK